MLSMRSLLLQAGYSIIAMLVARQANSNEAGRLLRRVVELGIDTDAPEV